MLNYEEISKRFIGDQGMKETKYGILWSPDETFKMAITRIGLKYSLCHVSIEFLEPDQKDLFLRPSENTNHSCSFSKSQEYRAESGPYCGFLKGFQPS
jgi:hypothetical protein